jgi:homoserine O-acetyltransferase
MVIYDRAAGQEGSSMIRTLKATALVLAAIGALTGVARAQSPPALDVRQGDYIARDFHFRDGESLPELRLHYRTLGTPRRDASGHVTNAVMILHGTGGTGAQFLQPQFASVLFAPGGLLDPAKWYIVLPDGVGHGGSSKPSDGLHARFPTYDYDDMVAAQHELLVKGLGVEHLRLILGTSMGCMHSFVWGETWPQFMDALMPLACLPTQIAGRNRIWRKMAMDAITSDPDWKGGDYDAEPERALRTVEDIQLIAGSAPLLWQHDYGARDAADAYLAQRIGPAIAGADANDVLYALAASRNYDPSPNLERITVPVMWINSADDFINPPELGIAQQMAPRLKHGRFILIPISLQTHGHGTHTWADVWKDHLAELLKDSER